MRYSTIVRNYLAMEKGKPAAKSGEGKVIRYMIDACEVFHGTTPSLVVLTGAIMQAGYRIKDAPNEDTYYASAYAKVPLVKHRDTTTDHLKTILP